jgi:flagellar P-ring protein precursor FlgI
MSMRTDHLWNNVGAVAAAVLCLCALARGARIKDIASVQGVRANQLYGFGVVVGLSETGSGSEFSAQLARHMLLRNSISRGLPELEADNLTAVTVTADLPPFARPGTEIDVTVSALDEATSLRGGTLILTPLKGPDGRVYAVAQGPITVGGFSFEGAAAEVQQGHPTVGRIPNGAIVERGVETNVVEDGALKLCLRHPDFTTAGRMASAINDKLSVRARPVDAGVVQVELGDVRGRSEIMRRISRIEQLRVRPDQEAVVVVNEKTGTVVAGSHVSLSRVAISHGNLTVITEERPQVSQPPPLSRLGLTRVLPRTRIRVEESAIEEGGLNVLRRSATVGELARAMNLLGVGPRDIIAIFQALKQAGALHAKLKIM